MRDEPVGGGTTDSSDFSVTAIGSYFSGTTTLHRIRPHARLQWRAVIDYSVRRSERARRARIVVEAGGVEVVIPRRMALRHVAPFVEEKRPWIERTLRRMREAELDGPSVTLRDGGRVPYLGTVLTLRVRVDRGRADRKS